MIYLTTATTPEGVIFRGISTQPDDYVLPPNCVDTDDLTIPAAVTALGITEWGAFSETGLLQFYRLSGGNTLVLRSLTRYYYTVPAGTLIATFTDDVSVLALTPLVEQFVLDQYPGSEEPPLVCYAEEDGVSYGTQIYSVGEILVIYEWPNPPIPPGFTPLPFVGPVIPPYSTLQWDGVNWVVAPFPIDLNLAGAQDYLTKLVQANASALINNQLSSYDAAQIATSADPELLEPRYKAVNLYPTIGDYRTAVDAETAPLFVTISTAATVEDLYTFDPTVPEPPNYV